MSKLTKFVERIEAENKLFNSMSKAEKRVRIAEDCLERIQLNLINPYVNQFINPSDIQMLQQLNTDLKTSLNSSIQCTACAKGSLFLSYVGRVNNFDSCHLDDDNNIRSNAHKKLLEIFTHNQLSMIEYAFEGIQYLRYYRVKNERKEIEFSYTIRQKLSEIKAIYESPTDRMIFICENIIKNKGTYKP
jgi:hypothetical protein